MSKALNVLFRGYYNTHNLGDDLLFLALLEWFQAGLGLSGHQLNVWIETKEDSLPKLGYPHPYSEYTFTDPWKQQKQKLEQLPLIGKVAKPLMLLQVALTFIQAAIYRLTGLSFGLKSWLQQFKEVDVIHYVGGGYFNTRLRWGTQGLFFEWLLVSLAKLLKPEIKVVGTGLGIGPVDTNSFRWIFKQFAKQFEAIIVREGKSEAFINSLNTDTPTEVIADDVLLLKSYFERIKAEVEPNQTFGINLKFDDVHRYENGGEFFEKLINTCEARGESVTFFDFSRDHQALEHLPEAVRQRITQLSCYETGLRPFSEAMAKTSGGLGFAYHFAIVCALLDIPTINVYYDEYYLQKTGGVMALLCDKPCTVSFDELTNSEPETWLNQLNSLDRNHVPTLVAKLTERYNQLYQPMLQAKAILPGDESTKEAVYVRRGTAPKREAVAL